MLALVLTFVAQGALGQNTGLILTPADKLRGIPLASTRFRAASFRLQSTCPPSFPRPVTRAISSPAWAGPWRTD